MFHENSEFWGNLSEPVFAIARGSVVLLPLQQNIFRLAPEGQNQKL